MRRDSSMTISRLQRIHREDGVSLIQVALSILVLTAFLVVVLDYGVMWLARRQAQNAADAGALAGATARSYDETDDPPAANGVAFQSATAAAEANAVFGEAGGVRVTWECPAFAAGGRCVRVDVHRDGADIDGVPGADSNPLPVFFAQILGIDSQQVRATATAWVASGTTTNCMRPFAVADKWEDVVEITANPKKFQRWKKQGSTVEELNPKDRYEPRGSGSNPTSYTPEADLGTPVILKAGNNPNSVADAVSPGWTLPVQLPDGEGGYVSGANVYSNAIKYCIGNPVSIGDYLPTETGVMVGPTAQGTETDDDSLINQDPDAFWNTTTMSVDGSCAPGCADFSPRIVPIAIFDMDEFQWRTAENNWTTPWIPGVGPGMGSGFSCPAGGRCVRVVNIVGFFVEPMQGQDVPGRVVQYPGEFTAGAGGPASPFLTTIQLIR